VVLFSGYQKHFHRAHFDAGTFTRGHWRSFLWFHQLTTLASAAASFGTTKDSLYLLTCELISRGLIPYSFQDGLQDLLPQHTVKLIQNLVAPGAPDLYRNMEPLHRGAEEQFGVTLERVVVTLQGEEMLADARCAITGVPLRICFPDNAGPYQREHILFYAGTDTRVPPDIVSLQFYHRFKSWFKRLDRQRSSLLPTCVQL
jgi:hypothetical protein